MNKTKILYIPNARYLFFYVCSRAGSSTQTENFNDSSTHYQGTGLSPHEFICSLCEESFLWKHFKALQHIPQNCQPDEFEVVDE